MTIVSVWLVEVNKAELTQFLDKLAPRVEILTDPQWNYPSLIDPLVFLGFDQYILNEMEDAEDISFLISQSEELDFQVVYMRLRVSHKGRASVEAARGLSNQFLSRFKGFILDDEDTFWSDEEIKTGASKNGLQFLEAELRRV